MANLVDQIVETLAYSSDKDVIQEALGNAGFLFEKANGLQACGWTEEVIDANVTQADLSQLKNALSEFIDHTGMGCWSLGKSLDPLLKPVFVRALRRQLHDDSIELFQAMIALSNLGETIFLHSSGSSSLEVAKNRELAAAYLSRQG